MNSRLTNSLAAPDRSGTWFWTGTHWRPANGAPASTVALYNSLMGNGSSGGASSGTAVATVTGASAGDKQRGGRLAALMGAVITAAELEAESDRVAGMEAIPGVLYHTLTYPAAGVESLTAFDGSNDPAISNLGPNGLPQGQFFRISHLAVCPLNDVTATAVGTAAGAVNDLARLVRETRASWYFSTKDKPWPRCPLNVVGQVGGVGGLIGGAQPDAAGAVVQVPNLAVAPFNMRDIVLKALQQFRVVFLFKAGVSVSADLDFQVQLHGTWYRPAA